MGNMYPFASETQKLSSGLFTINTATVTVQLQSSCSYIRRAATVVVSPGTFITCNAAVV